MRLRLDRPQNIDPDDLYGKLVALGRNASDREARRSMAALVLLLANHIDDVEIVGEALGIVEALPAPGSTREEKHD